MFRKAAVLALGVHQHEAGGVPQLVAEVAVALAAAEVEVDIAAERRQRSEGEAQRIGAEGRDAGRVFLARGLVDFRRIFRVHQTGGAFGGQVINRNTVDQVDRVQRIALRLRHLLAAAVAHEPMHIDGLKRYFPGKMRGHHDHARHPEEDDVEAGHQHRGRQEGLVVRRFLGPAQ